jgi:hypothetical protein
MIVLLLLLQMAIADTIAGLPWTVKPLYGFITDSFPIHGRQSGAGLGCHCFFNNVQTPAVV